MIIIFPLRIEKIDPLISSIDSLNRERAFPVPWQLIELEQFDVSGILIAYVALVCTEMPQKVGLEWDFDPIETLAPDGVRYCPECLREDKFTPLPPHNKSGYCHKHRESDPVRKAKKRSPKNR